MKTVLITGASGGIGSAAVREFARQGYRVILHYHTQKDRAQALYDEVAAAGQDAYLCCADLARQEEAQRLAAEVLSRFPRIDVLVNNAAIARQQLFSDITDSDWREMFAVNVDSMFYLTQALLPGMIQRQGGRIINLSSMWGVTGGSCEVAYSAAKAAVIGFTKALAKEVGLSGITVNCVAPGVIDTPMNHRLTEQDRADLAEQTPLGRIGSPEEVARTIGFLASPAADFITGQVIQVNGGLVI